MKLKNVICKILFSKGFNALIFSWQDGELNSELKAKGVLFTYTLKRLSSCFTLRVFIGSK